MTKQTASPAEFGTDEFGFSVQISGPVDNALPVLTAEEDARASALEDAAQEQRLPGPEDLEVLNGGTILTLEEFFAGVKEQEEAQHKSAKDAVTERAHTAIFKLSEAVDAIFDLEEYGGAVGILEAQDLRDLREFARNVAKARENIRRIRSTINLPPGGPAIIDGSDVGRTESKPGMREETF